MRRQVCLYTVQWLGEGRGEREGGSGGDNADGGSMWHSSLPLLSTLL